MPLRSARRRTARTYYEGADVALIDRGERNYKNDGGCLMKKVILSSIMFLSGLLSVAVLLREQWLMIGMLMDSYLHFTICRSMDLSRHSIFLLGLPF